VRKNILITGASSGLGEEMARQFAALGRNLALCARRASHLDRLAGELKSAHPGITVSVRRLDVTDHDAVFTAFRAFADDFGTLDRVIVNAGIGKGQPIGTGSFHANRHTAETNFVAALAQCEAALEIFRAQNFGHLVLISSISALRGFPGNATTYAATKAGLSALGEGIRADTLRTPITVTTLLPGYIHSDLSPAPRTPLTAETEPGVRAMIRAIEREPGTACVPPWPWRLIAPILRAAPVRLLARLR
jgi:short-subunit dehydrogenase